MSILITLIVVLIIGGWVWYLISLLPLPSPIGQIVQALIILVLVLYLLGVLFGAAPLPVLR